MSNNPLRDMFMQSVFTSKRSKPVAESTRQQVSKPLIMEVKRYISLRVYRTEQLQNDPNPAHISCLEAGRQYSIVLQCTANRIDADQQEITINGPFRLYLECLVDQGICPFTLPQNQLDFVGPFTAAIKIPFNLPQEDCPSCNVTFNAMFVAHETFGGPPPASRTLIIKGNFTPENPEWLSTRYIAVGVPKNTIVLSAEPTNALTDKDSECLLTARNFYHDPFSQNIPFGNFSINIGESIDKGQKSRAEILHNVKMFSRSYVMGNFVRWIRAVKMEVEKRDKQLTLVVLDKTRLEIPWELLEIDYQQHLGAVALVARWLELDDFGMARLLKVEESVSEGSVISYLDQGLEETGEERTLLQTFVHSEMPSLEAFHNRLGESLQDVGLLYVGSHGSGGVRLFSSSRGSTLQVSSLDHLFPHVGPRPTLFLNACESARIMYKREMFIDNLVKSFLLLCASNYIGTIANVNSAEAPKIANRILKLAREDKGIQIVELLRRLRANAVKCWLDTMQNLSGKKETENRQQLHDQAAAQLLNTFAYVYYGNPLARLHLHPAQDAQEGA